MFGKKICKNKINDAVNEISKLCLEPDELAARLNNVFFKKTGRGCGHIHFYFRNKSDHIVFLWFEGETDKILAKSVNCEKGQYTHWVNSEFRDYECKDIFKKLHGEIERIEMDSGFHKTWASYAEFIDWLIENQK